MKIKSLICCMVLSASATVGSAAIFNSTVVKVYNSNDAKVFFQLYSADTNVACSDGKAVESRNINDKNNFVLTEKDILPIPACNTNNFKIRVWGAFKENFGTSNVFKKGSVCTLRTDGAFDQKYSAVCQ